MSLLYILIEWGGGVIKVYNHDGGFKRPLENGMAKDCGDGMIL